MSTKSRLAEARLQIRTLQANHNRLREEFDRYRAANTPEVLPAGIYDARIAEVEDYVPQTGRRLYRITFELDDYPGKKVWNHYARDTRHVWRFLYLAGLFDIVADDEAGWKQRVADELVGRQCRVRLAVETHSFARGGDRGYNKVEEVLSRG